MRVLFEMDAKDYDPSGTLFVRPSVRSIIIRENRVAMVHSLKYDYYKFPGGGLEAGEAHTEALIRETAEETGLSVLPETIRAYGMVRRIQKSKWSDEEIFVQDNYYYLCAVEPDIRPQRLDDYETAERFTLEWVDPLKAIDRNRSREQRCLDQRVSEREAGVLTCLLTDRYLTKG